MEIASRLNGIGEYYFSQKLREIDVLNKQGADVINLGIGSPDLPPHPDVIETLSKEAAKPGSHAYQSYKGSIILRQAISGWYYKWYQVELDPESEILPLIGSKEGLMHICMAYINNGDKVLVPDPGYPTYSSAVKIAGGECISYGMGEDKDHSDLMEMRSGELSKVKLMFVNYPHMPTGTLGNREWFVRLVSFARQNNILLIHDNPYSFILNDEPLSMLSVDGAKECVIELNSLSKSHNMAGWRIGMMCGSKENIDNVLRFKSNMDSGMFLPVQLAAARALELGKDWFVSLNAIYHERRKLVIQLLEDLECEFTGDQAGLFLWVKKNNRYNSGFEMSDEILKRYSIFITPGGIFGSAGNNYLRASLCVPKERIEQAIKRVKK